MNKAFEKIIEKLREVPTEYRHNEYNQAIYDVIEFINRLESNNGWIPVEDKLPPDDKYILLSFFNFYVPKVGRYEETEDGGGNFFAGDEDVTLISQDLFVNAWQPLPEPYKGEYE